VNNLNEKMSISDKYANELDRKLIQSIVLTIKLSKKPFVKSFLRILTSALKTTLAEE
jgi:hypothetical protein